MKKNFLLLFILPLIIYGQNNSYPYTKIDTLKGSNTEYRDWWDVKKYILTVEPDIISKSLQGTNEIIFDSKAVGTMQLDLQEPMQIDEIFTDNNTKLSFTKDGDIYLIDLKGHIKNYSSNNKIIIKFSGKPKLANNPPWDGGWIFTIDNDNNPWVTVACEGIGASVWFPCKEYLGDKIDGGMELSIITSQKGVGNGKLISNSSINKTKNIYTWNISNPISNYNIIPYIGNYVNFSDTYNGLKGKLTLNYWVLPSNLEKAKDHFSQVKKMLKAFEYWLGPYPFYEDGYKLIETPYLGMEHQSGIAYGNQYLNGYLGNDLSNTDVGLNWDYIIVHESGHEWFGNSITCKDLADMWIHEAFTTYTETLFTEYFYGKDKANEYIIGQRNLIENEHPIIGNYGVREKGSVDMYFKGANMIHTIRQEINNDSIFRDILIGLNKEFYHQTVSSKQIENYISEKSGIDFSKVFDQYLRTTNIPTLEYYQKGNELIYRWNYVVPEFTMNIKTSLGNLKPSSNWKSMRMPKNSSLYDFKVDKNYYINTINTTR
ncbi:M1 family peptidase [Apibacter muscae]|uniref:M1 family peptidase n=1 Tax=Apibacter muscae TaxID=2509004 RepID=A0A563D9I9_9FLAO|nr:M1 family metallopeptidase [Apibacter muscae]TWP26729.1 M1 family peptidase [Apibacter muscae]